VTARQMLDKLDDFFVTADDIEARALWDVLTALRGPDWVREGDTHTSKLGSTNIIRRRAFPQLARHVDRRAKGVPASFDTLGEVIDPAHIQGTPSHFTFHIYEAAHALDIKFTTNSPKPVH